ncbi:hypothetical protein BV20DRAFT_41077 [Pilatotrama ljubarskyi]|nr:hypothetical protein BV20DRAFT_41077 [Pilatotrama ljubarskyi]
MVDTTSIFTFLRSRLHDLGEAGLQRCRMTYCYTLCTRILLFRCPTDQLEALTPVLLLLLGMLRVPVKLRHASSAQLELRRLTVACFTTATSLDILHPLPERVHLGRGKKERGS